jgi:hypothetical protein
VADLRDSKPENSCFEVEKGKLDVVLWTKLRRRDGE